MDATEGLQALGAEILADAERNAQEKVQVATERAARIRHETEQERAAEIAAAIARAQREAEQERRRMTAVAEVAARQRLLAAREELIGRALALAQDSLRAGLSPEQRRSDITMAILQAAQALGGGELTVQCSARDRPFLDEVLPGVQRELSARGLTVRLSAGPPVTILGGAVVSKDEGREIIDNSFDARLERQNWALRNAIWNILQGGATGNAGAGRDH